MQWKIRYPDGHSIDVLNYSRVALTNLTTANCNNQHKSALKLTVTTLDVVNFQDISFSLISKITGLHILFCFSFTNAEICDKSFFISTLQIIIIVRMK